MSLFKTILNLSNLNEMYYNVAKTKCIPVKLLKMFIKDDVIFINDFFFFCNLYSFQICILNFVFLIP